MGGTLALLPIALAAIAATLLAALVVDALLARLVTTGRITRPEINLSIVVEIGRAHV